MYTVANSALSNHERRCHDKPRIMAMRKKRNKNHSRFVSGNLQHRNILPNQHENPRTTMNENSTDLDDSLSAVAVEEEISVAHTENSSDENDNNIMHSVNVSFALKLLCYFVFVQYFFTLV